MTDTPTRVLLIEDSPEDADLIAEALDETPESRGAGLSIELVHADRLADGLQRIQAGGIDLVLLDLSLPDCHGLETFHRTQAAAPELPIVVLSGLADEALAVRTVREGAQDYLVKGEVDGRVLVRSLRYAVERKRAELEHARFVHEQTARKEAETARARLLELFLRAPASIALLRGADHVFELVNEAFVVTSGRASAEELVGLTVREAFPEIEGQGYFELLDRVYRTGESHVGTEQLARIRRRGQLEEAFFNFSLQPYRGDDGAIEGIISHSIEVTEQVVSRQRIEALAAQRSAILSQTAEGVIVTDPSGQTVFINEAARRLHGVPDHAPAAGQDGTAYEVLTVEGEPYPVDDLPLVRALLRGETIADALWRIRRADGSEIVAHGSATPIRAEDGTSLGAVLVLRDVTAQYNLERERDAFLAAASHDLKNPLAAIKGTAQVLKRHMAREAEVDPRRLSAGLDVVESTSARMVAMIDELLDVSRVRMGRRLMLNPEPTDLVALAQRVVSVQQLATEHHRLVLQCDEPVLIGEWDPARLERVLGNLLGNAVKYSPGGGEITVSLAREDDGDRAVAVVQVRDQGIGIPAADIDRVFERFQRGSNAIGRVAGTGIGLAGARHIVEQHGGTIGVESTEGVGSTFTIRLPLGPAAASGGAVCSGGALSVSRR